MGGDGGGVGAVVVRHVGARALTGKHARAQSHGSDESRKTNCQSHEEDLTTSLSGSRDTRTELMTWNREHLIVHEPLEAIVR